MTEHSRSRGFCGDQSLGGVRVDSHRGYCVKPACISTQTRCTVFSPRCPLGCRVTPSFTLFCTLQQHPLWAPQPTPVTPSPGVGRGQGWAWDNR